MLKKKSKQIDMFNHMIFEKLIPKNHLLVKIDKIIDFSFVYEKVKDRYSSIGRGSEDPAMMFKILLLEYLYRLSDPEVVNRIKTDIAFRWFLGLNIDDEVPDDTTISYFRVKRLDEENFNDIFTEIVKKCIENDLVKTKRYIIDTTDVAANVNYPSDKRLIGNAFKKVINEVAKFDEELAISQFKQFDEEIDNQYEHEEKVNAKKHFEIAKKYMEYLYLKTYAELQQDGKYKETFGMCYEIIDQYINNSKDKIVSTVDPDARIAHKSPENIKRGYKDHIIVDEDSEIILASIQTPFNTGDEKKLQELVEKVEQELKIKPEEITSDKVYGTIDNRAYLKDKEILSNIAFYKESDRETMYYGLKDFNIAESLDSVTCPNGVITENYTENKDKTQNRDYRRFQFDKKICCDCPLKEKCLYKNKKGKLQRKGRAVEVPLRYDAVLNDLKRNTTKEFDDASNKRFKVERRFATMVRNHGLRRCRYLRLKGAKIHITLANMASNIVRMVNMLYPPGEAAVYGI